MFAYYGSIQWQVFAVFVAAATIIIATLPFVVPESRFHSTALALEYFLFNEIFAGLFLAVGYGFLERNRTLAHRWIHWPTTFRVRSIG